MQFPSLLRLVGLVAGLVQSTSAAPPLTFTANPSVGPGGTRYKDSPHFRVYNAQSDSQADSAIASLEAAYSCFVTDLGWRSTGLSFRQESDDGPFYKVNVYRVDNIPGASANTGTDQRTGLSFLNVVTQYMNVPAVTVHEFGHALTYAASVWIDQIRTGAWWEVVAQFVADTYLTSSLCARARTEFGQREGDTLVELRKVIGDSFQVIVDGTRNTGNYYQAWPFLTYLVSNPDGFPGMGLGIFPGVWTRYRKGSNETPLHVLERLAAPATRIQTIVGRYWARMAYVDIGHAKMQASFTRERRNINYTNWDSLGGGSFRVKSARQPRYMGANITPLRNTGAGSVNVTVSAGAPFTATLVVKYSTGEVRYVDLPQGAGGAVLGPQDEASLVVANTPDSLLLFDPFQLPATPEANRGLDYRVQLTGASI